MKLKGVNSKKLKSKQKKKMEETLKRMEETRKQDSENLRDLAQRKLAWAKQEKEKGLDLIKKTQVQVYKLEGIILAYEDLLKPQEKND